MTAESTLDAENQDETLHCYRHTDRETYIRCGRCDRPICIRCAMQGPVGFRCKSCGKPAHDPLTSFRPQQLVLGSVVSVGASAVGAFIGLKFGFFIIFVGFFAGGLIADAVMRFTGYKRGPIMIAVLLGGIAVGTLVGAVLDYSFVVGQFHRVAGVEFESAYPLLTYLADNFAWGAIYAGAAMAGAWGRLRF